MSTKTFYLLECTACTKQSFALIMPFGTAEKRSEWAREHAGAHEDGTTWLLAEETREQETWPSETLS